MEVYKDSLLPVKKVSLTVSQQAGYITPFTDQQGVRHLDLRQGWGRRGCMHWYGKMYFAKHYLQV